MKAPQNNSGGDFEKHPAGWALGVCTRVIDLGTHFNDQKQKDQRKLMIAFESEKLITDDGDYKGQPFLLFANFNYSMYQNAMLCGFVQDWRGRRFEDQAQADNFDLSKLLGQKAYMNVAHNGKYVNIQTIGPVPEGMTAPEPNGDLILIDQDNLDPLMVEKLTDKMKERVLSAKERNEAPTQQAPQQSTQPNTEAGDPGNMGDFDDDVPF